VLDYGIPVEPYLFLVDTEGDVFAKFEGVVGDDELRAAIEDALAQAHLATAGRGGQPRRWRFASSVS
jgi:hypothetical protein